MILVKRDYEVLEHMVFPVLVLGLLGLACEIDAQNFIIEYFAHCRYQLVIDDLCCVFVTEVFIAAIRFRNASINWSMCTYCSFVRDRQGFS